ncbi:bifunctional chorismate mutase/prephenate dehydrogenase [Enterobacteriaceae endosymbiont of Neohaemonia nigricornis]|uniref:bifunctional chorismate mutase/prephenate dehydrogenase n=1 Tax=Enterobacteriaceae endosymbiont of Neohaemonia nigricornis TaxID=2675792 RepID=UPI001449B9DC|nr:bifunctional chorismate mutase/prephenate dehydrogenase [Enterobacteriaceae endosymbiont of Neohaemonia nigricornis]QJC30560.1 bifunctional chorismate mutase/prephenate dehydrogenase [Enterobacteriaceae endosymbiont of Neohaemonia nigricornis]
MIKKLEYKQNNILNNKLNLLRDKIDILDTKLLSILSKRYNLVKKIGKIKQQHGLPVYILEREKYVINLRKKEAKNIGLSANFIEKILNNIMYESYIYENMEGFKKLNINLKKILIIGKIYNTGYIFKKLLTLSNYDVSMINHDFWLIKNFHSYFIDVEMIILNISITSLNDVLKYLPKLSNNCILVDITPIKYISINKILDQYSGPVLYIYPILPSNNISILTKQKIIYSHGRLSNMYNWFLKQIKLWGAELVHIKDHKNYQYISIIQALQYFNMLTMNAFLLKEKYQKKIFKKLIPLFNDLEYKYYKNFFTTDIVLYQQILISVQKKFNLYEQYINHLNNILFLIKNKNINDINNINHRIKEFYNINDHQN